jgi:hypothetical protein
MIGLPPTLSVVALHASGLHVNRADGPVIEHLDLHTSLPPSDPTHLATLLTYFLALPTN